MSNDEFTKLFRYMVGMRKDIDAEFAQVHMEFDRIYGLFDSVNKQCENLEQESLVVNQQLDRHEKWLDQLAVKTDTKLRPER